LRKKTEKDSKKDFCTIEIEITPVENEEVKFQWGWLK